MPLSKVMATALKSSAGGASAALDFYIPGAGEMPAPQPKQRQPVLWCRLLACSRSFYPETSGCPAFKISGLQPEQNVSSARVAARPC